MSHQHIINSTNVHEQDACVDSPLIQQKAEALKNKMENDFVAADGWFQHWKKRENTVYKCVHGEQKYADFLGPENWTTNKWPKNCSELSSCDVYNADETLLLCLTSAHLHI